MKAPLHRATVTALATVVLCVAVLAVFRPLFTGGFFLDDLVRLYDLANFGLGKLLLSQHGGHMLLASNGVYAVFKYLFGLEPHRWFVAVVALHAINTVLLFSTLRRFGCRDLIALTMAAVWGLCPVQAASLGWIAAFGHVLLGTIVLLWLRDAATVARQGVRVEPWRIGLWWMLGILAATSFGIGIGLTGTLPLAAICLLPSTPNRTRVVTVLGSLLVVLPVLYFAQHALYARLYPVPPFMSPSITGHIGPSDMITRGAQVAWCLLDFMVFGLGVLLLGSLTTRSDVGRDVMLMWLLLPAGALLALSGWALRKGSWVRRSQAAGVVLLALGGYASVAAVVVFERLGLAGQVAFALQRAGVAQSVVLASQTMTPRYHYVPTLFLVALLALATDTAWARRPARTTLALTTMLFWLSLRAYWDRDMIAGEVRFDILRRERAFLESAVANARTATLFLTNAPPWTAIALHNEQFPGRAAACVIHHPDGVVNGTTVRFVEPDSSLLASVRAQPDTPIAHLMVSPAEAPPGTW